MTTRLQPVAWCAGLIIAINCTVGKPTNLMAQDTSPSAWGRAPDVNSASSSGRVAWLGAWSPLRPIADIPRGLLRAPLSPGLLEAPAPVVGAFVLTGAPGSLFRDFQPRLRGDSVRFSELRVQHASDHGTFRRPLDVADSRVTQISGLGWSPIGTNGFALGRIVVDQEHMNVSSFTARVAPYGSSPFVSTDSVTPPMLRTRARVEGALGMKIGDFGLGISAGLDAREHNSIDFPLRRTGRASTPAILVGVERVMPWAGLRIGGYYRWTEPNETNVLSAVPLPTVIYSVQGYDDPSGIPVTNGQPVIVRNDNRANALGGSADFLLWRSRIVLVYERGDRAEDQYRNLVSRVRATDAWRANGNQWRFVAQREFAARVRGTMIVSKESLTGSAIRSDLTGIAFAGRDERAAVEADVRIQIGTRWNAAMLGGAVRNTSARTDFVAAISSDRQVAMPFVGAELSREFGKVGLSAGTSMAATIAAGNVPVVNRTANYQRIIAPALSYDIADARAVAGWMTALVPFRRGSLLLSVRRESASPATEFPSRLQPSGDRTGWKFSMGVRR